MNQEGSDSSSWQGCRDFAGSPMYREFACSPVEWDPSFPQPGDTPEFPLRPISEQSLRRSEETQSVYVDSNGSIVGVGHSPQPGETLEALQSRPFSQQSLRPDSQQSQSMHVDSHGSAVDYGSTPPYRESPELPRRPYSEQSLRPISEQAQYCDTDLSQFGWQ